MNIVQPKIKIQRLRDTNPEVCEVLDLLKIILMDN